MVIQNGKSAQTPSTFYIGSRSAEGDHQDVQTSYCRFEPVAPDYRPDAGRRASEDQIARLQFHQLWQLMDGFGNRPDHVCEVSLCRTLPFTLS